MIYPYCLFQHGTAFAANSYAKFYSNCRLLVQIVFKRFNDLWMCNIENTSLAQQPLLSIIIYEQETSEFY